MGKVASRLPLRRSHLIIEPSLPEVNSIVPDSEATAAVTEKRWPFRRIDGGFVEVDWGSYNHSEVNDCVPLDDHCYSRNRLGRDVFSPHAAASRNPKNQ